MPSTRRRATAAATRTVLAPVPVIVAALALAACGGNGGDGGGEASGAAPTSATASTNLPATAAASAVPDACGLYPAEALEAAFGVDAGAGRPGSFGPQRKVCTYGRFTIVGVSETARYQVAVDSATQRNSLCSPVEGVGDRATFCTSAGVLGQLLWVDGDLMYDITAESLDQAPFVSLASTLR